MHEVGGDNDSQRKHVSSNNHLQRQYVDLLQLTILNPTKIDQYKQKTYQFSLYLYLSNMYCSSSYTGGRERSPPRRSQNNSDEAYQIWVIAGKKLWQNMNYADIPLSTYGKKRMHLFFEHGINYLSARKIVEKEAAERPSGPFPPPHAHENTSDGFSIWGKWRMNQLLGLEIFYSAAESIVVIEENKREGEAENYHREEDQENVYSISEPEYEQSDLRPNHNDRGKCKISAKTMSEYKELYLEFIIHGMSREAAETQMNKEIFQDLRRQGQIPDDYVPKSSFSGPSRGSPRRPRSPSPKPFSSRREGRTRDPSPPLAAWARAPYSREPLRKFRPEDRRRAPSPQPFGREGRSSVTSESRRAPCGTTSDSEHFEQCMVDLLDLGMGYDEARKLVEDGMAAHASGSRRSPGRDDNDRYGASYSGSSYDSW